MFLYYHLGLVDQWNSIKQGSLSITEYINHFEDLMLKSKITKNLTVTLSRFKLGPRPDFERELLHGHITDLD